MHNHASYHYILIQRKNMTIDPLSLLQEMIKFPSVTPEDKGIQKYLANILNDMGFSSKHLPFSSKDMPEIKNLYSRFGTKGPHLCFAGHTDVVPTGDETAWKHDPFGAVIEDGILYGRGTSDMKGGIACFIAAISEVLKENENIKGSISLLITGDEEGPAINGTAKVLKWMHDNNEIPDVALVGESSNVYSLGEEIKIGRRGSLNGTITIFGKQGHVAYPHLACNPLPRLAEIMHLISTHIFDKGSAYFPQTSLQITNIEGGVGADNVFPAQAKARFNVRFSDRWDAQALENKIRNIIENTDYDYKLECTSNAKSFLTKPGEWTNCVSRAVEDIIDRKPELTANGGTSDARFISQYCKVVEFGLTNETIHQVNENCKVEDLYTLTQIYKQIIKTYLGIK